MDNVTRYLLFPSFEDLNKAFEQAKDLARNGDYEQKKLALTAFETEIAGFKQLLDIADIKNISYSQVKNIIGATSYQLLFRHLNQAVVLSLHLQPDKLSDIRKRYYKAYRKYDIDKFTEHAMRHIDQYLKVHEKHAKTRKTLRNAANKQSKRDKI